jgi:uncharacterized coiled-coil protein SlyX
MTNEENWSHLHAALETMCNRLSDINSTLALVQKTLDELKVHVVGTRMAVHSLNKNVEDILDGKSKPRGHQG